MSYFAIHFTNTQKTELEVAREALSKQKKLRIFSEDIRAKAMKELSDLIEEKKANDARNKERIEKLHGHVADLEQTNISLMNRLDCVDYENFSLISQVIH